MGKRLISLLLAVVLVLSLAGLTTAFAVEGDGDTTSTETTVTDETEDTATQTAPADDSSSGSENANNTDESTGQASTASVISDDNTETETTLSAAEVQALIDALPSVEELSAMTTEEQLEVYYATQEANDAYYALSDEDQELVDDSALDELFEYFNSLTDETAPGDQGGGNSPSSISVYWDTVTVGSNNKLSAGNSTTGVGSVTMDGSTVPHGNSGNRQNSGGLTYTMTYNTSDTATVVITPATGYYVTFVCVNCCGSGAAIDCETYETGGAFSANFTIDSSGTITLNIPLDDTAGFHHNSNSGTYFILIHVSPIPSPLYVEYEYGNVSDFLSDVTGTVFADPDAWTDTDSNNNMVNSSSNGGGVVTEDTQYKYVYATGSESDAASWTHYANSITAEAEALAASYGYYFAGWEVTYYTDCTDFDFSGVYGSGSSYYQEGYNVPLITHVKLVAVWVKANVTPGTLTISKEISGIDTTLVSSITFTVTNINGGTVGTVTLSADNNWTASIENIEPGNYTVTESGYTVANYNCTASVDGTELSDYSTTVTVTSDGVKSELGDDGLYSYSVTTNNASVAFTNTYTKATTSITITKQVTGNMGDTSKYFTFTVKDSNGTAIVPSDSEEGATTFTLKDDDVATLENLTIGSTIYLSEENGEYTVTVEDANGTKYTATDGVYEITVSEGLAITVTNEKEVIVDTGVTLSTLPFVLILTASLSGLGLVVINRKRRDSDG